MQNDTQFDEQKIKKYLYGEMSDAERDAMEDEFFDNDELFVEIAETENLLVDLYVRKQLSGEELLRFESSLGKFPERRSKVANAAALQTFIDEERVVEERETFAVGQTFWQKIGELFSFKSPAFGYSMATLFLLFAIASVFLLLDNRRKAGEIANLQNSQQSDLEQKIKKLELQLNENNASLEELKNQSIAQGDAGDAAVADYQEAEEEKKRLQQEIERLKQQKENIPIPTQTPKTTPQQIFAFLLAPTISTRGGDTGASSRKLIIPGEAKQITLHLALPENFDKTTRLTVKLNDKILASNLPARKTLQVPVTTTDINEGINRISIVNAEGKEISKYIFIVQKK